MGTLATNPPAARRSCAKAFGWGKNPLRLLAVMAVAFAHFVRGSSSNGA